MDLGLRGKSALVVASSTGLGRAVAVRMGSEGMRVTLCARSSERLAEAAAEVERAGGEAHAATADIADPKAVEGVVAAARERFGGVDVLEGTIASESGRCPRGEGGLSNSIVPSISNVEVRAVTGEPCGGAHANLAGVV